MEQISVFWFYMIIYRQGHNLYCMSEYSIAVLYPTLCNPMDCNTPVSSVRGISQARILEWVAIFSSWDPPDLCLLH